MFSSHRDSLCLLLSAISLYAVAETGIFLFYPVSCFFLFALVIARLFVLHARTNNLRYFYIMAYASVAWTVFGQLLSFSTFYSLNGFDLSLPYLPIGLPIGESLDLWQYLCKSLSLTFLYSSLFIFFSSTSFVREQEERITNSLIQLLTLNQRTLPRFCFAIGILCSSLLIFLVLKGVLGWRGAMNDRDIGYGLSWWVPFMELSMQLLPPISALPFSLSRTKALYRIAATVFFAIGAYVSFAIGRRSIVYYLFATIYSYIFYYRFANGRLPKLSLAKIIFLSLVIYILPKLLLFSQFLRTLNFSAIDLLSIFSSYETFIEDDTQIEMTLANQDLNYLSRPLLHSSLALILKLKSFEFSYFTDLVDSFLMSLPSFIFPYKLDLLSSKTIVGNALGISLDWTSTPPTIAFVSFGLLGFIIYPLVQVSIFSLFVYSTYKLGFFSPSIKPNIIILSSFMISNLVQGFTEGNSVNLVRPFIVIFAVLFLLFYCYRLTPLQPGSRVGRRNSDIAPP